jgi:hypothetical protein
MDPETHKGLAVIQRGEETLGKLELAKCIPHNYVLCAAFDGNNAWVGTSKGLALAVGEGYYPGLRPTTTNTTPSP